MQARPGARLSHYRLLEKVGEGGMGVVYRGHDERLDRDIAVKVLPAGVLSDEVARKRFRIEALALSKLNHPSIETIHDFDTQQGVDFLVMEYIPGTTLDRALASGPLAESHVVRLAMQLAEGLTAAHEQGVIHRDLKPNNLRVTPDGRLKILDFGLAKLLRPVSEDSQAETLSQTQGVIGTLPYMAPEQLRSEPVDGRTDIFAAGVVLYEMATGLRPFREDTAPRLTDAILHQAPPTPRSVNARLSPALERIILKCLEKDPGKRYQRTRVLIEDLRRIEAATARRWALPVAMAAVALVGSLVAMWHLGTRPQPSAPPERRGVALLPLAYEGPEEKAHLKNVIPLALADRLRASPRLLIAPFASSRSFISEEDPRGVARQLGVDWVVEGRMRIDGESFVATLRTVRGDDGEQTWVRTVQGAVGDLLPEADRVAGELATALGAGRAPAERPGGRREPRALELYFQGQSFLEGWDVERNYVRAQAAAREAIEIDAEFAEAHALLSRALMTHYSQTREPALIQQSLDAADRALDLDPSLPEGHLALGAVDLSRGRSVEAAASFQKGLDLAPADDSLCRRIAGAYSKLGRDHEAEKMYQRAIDLRPTYWANYNSKGTFCFHRARLDEARELFRQVIKLRPESDTGYTNLAAVYILAGEHEEAEPLLQAALRISPSHETRNNLGVVYYATGLFEDAAREWREAAEGGVQSPMIHANLGDAYRHLGRSKEARIAYERAIQMGRAHLRVNPADIEARAMLATALAGVGRCTEARREASRSAKESPGNPTISYYAAITSTVCGDRAAAIRHAVHAIEGGILVDVRTNPDLKPLLNDPTIERLLR